MVWSTVEEKRSIEQVEGLLGAGAVGALCSLQVCNFQLFVEQNIIVC